MIRGRFIAIYFFELLSPKVSEINDQIFKNTS